MALNVNDLDLANLYFEENPTDVTPFVTQLATNINTHFLNAGWPPSGYFDATYKYDLATLVGAAPISPLLDLYTGSRKETTDVQWGTELGNDIADYWESVTFTGTKTLLAHPFTVEPWTGNPSALTSRAPLIANLISLYTSTTGPGDVEVFRTLLGNYINVAAGLVYLENPLFLLI